MYFMQVSFTRTLLRRSVAHNPSRHDLRLLRLLIDHETRHKVLHGSLLAVVEGL